MQRAIASHPPLVSAISWGRAGYQGRGCCVVRSAGSFVSSAPYCKGSVDGRRFQREWKKSGLVFEMSSTFLCGNNSVCTSHFTIAILKSINVWSKRAILLLHSTD